MSTDHYIYCMDCNQYQVPGFIFDFSQHQVEHLIRIAPLLLKVKALYEELWEASYQDGKSTFDFDIDVTFDEQRLKWETIQFLEAHQGHSLVSIPEYEAITRDAILWCPHGDK